jgi:hypothetical protein
VKVAGSIPAPAPTLPPVCRILRCQWHLVDWPGAKNIGHAHNPNGTVVVFHVNGGVKES